MKGVVWGVVVLVVLVGFAASELGIWINGKYRPISASEPCPTLDMAAVPGNAITFKKSLCVSPVCDLPPCRLDACVRRYGSQVVDVALDVHAGTGGPQRKVGSTVPFRSA
jgi:hypothetical protein